MAQVLRLLPPPSDPDLLVDATTADDAAVYRIRDDVAVVLTVDYFTPIVDDPYDFGRIAATNALSDVYAMGARPVLALNLVGFPANELSLDILNDILRGGADQAALAGVCVAGGHSIDDPEPKYGMAVMGFAHPACVLSNASAKPGDVLFLTKPIGTGIIATAIKQQAAEASLIERAVAIMTTLNRAAAEAAARVTVHACTDVTGFGLLGHLHEMTSASKVGARISASAVPVIEGVWPLVEDNWAPGGTYANLEFLESEGALVWEDEIPDNHKLLLADAQTSGGLLISCAPEDADRLEELLHSPEIPAAARIGEIIEDSRGRIFVPR